MDNDQDGCADDPAVLKKLTAKDDVGERIMMMFTDDSVKTDESRALFSAKLYQVGQVVDAAECEPNCAGLNYGKNNGCQDATTEESLHLLQASAISPLYPKMLKTEFGSKSSLTKGLDIAR